MIMNPCPLDHAIAVLNEMVRLDSEATRKLVEFRAPCNKQLADHPSIQVAGEDTAPLVGVLGMLNGIFGTHGVEAGKFEGWGPIAAVFEDDGRLVRFERLVDPVCKTI